MKSFLKIGSYILNPLWIPFLGAVIYFIVTPKFYPTPIIEAKLFAILILGLFVPLLFVFLLKNAKIIQSIRLKTNRDRRLVLLFIGLLLLTINNFIIKEEIYELGYFYNAILCSLAISFLLTYIKYQISIHTMALAALLGFALQLLLLYNLNLTLLIATIVFSLGWLSSSRLTFTNHKSSEIIMGILIGLLPQLFYIFFIVVRYKI